MNRTGIKTGEGLKDFLRRYFKANRDKELTKADVMLKFGRCRQVTEQAIKHLCESGELESVQVIRLREKGMR